MVSVLQLALSKKVDNWQNDWSVRNIIRINKSAITHDLHVALRKSIPDYICHTSGHRELILGDSNDGTTKNQTQGYNDLKFYG
jgi:hypothetical protein